jgi:elongation factor G
MSTETRGSLTIIDAEVPLAKMFGYATEVRSMSQGKAGFTMEFLKYKRVPAAIQLEIIEAAKKLKK